MDEQQLQAIGTDFIGNYGWLFVVGFLAVLFRSTIEGLTESFKIFWGNSNGRKFEFIPKNAILNFFLTFRFLKMFDFCRGIIA